VEEMEMLNKRRQQNLERYSEAGFVDIRSGSS